MNAESRSRPPSAAAIVDHAGADRRHAPSRQTPLPVERSRSATSAFYYGKFEALKDISLPLTTGG